ncbi:hypothetical protein IW261DRAFT_1413781 [Armillaria novae-zelandiae]|uniref:Uncharacterized protein n=1 Tax=Armillaria novae-zelandiae TaxID=153914 RepID=A0AA39PWS1_9AGAR|nr:hypothetical protein IW261DRAFT_1413781 [Armillaria novae-zelandiae]
MPTQLRENIMENSRGRFSQVPTERRRAGGWMMRHANCEMGLLEEEEEEEGSAEDNAASLPAATHNEFSEWIKRSNEEEGVTPHGYFPGFGMHDKTAEIGLVVRGALDWWWLWLSMPRTTGHRDDSRTLLATNVKSPANVDIPAVNVRPPRQAHTRRQNSSALPVYKYPSHEYPQRSRLPPPAACVGSNPLPPAQKPPRIFSVQTWGPPISDKRRYRRPSYNEMLITPRLEARSSIVFNQTPDLIDDRGVLVDSFTRLSEWTCEKKQGKVIEKLPAMIDPVEGL